MRTLWHAALLVSEVRPGIGGEAPRAGGGVVGIAAVVFSEVCLPVGLGHETVSREKKQTKKKSYTNRHMRSEPPPNTASMKEKHLKKEKTKTSRTHFPRQDDKSSARAA